MRDKAYGLLAGCDVADGMNSGVLLCDGALGALVGNRIVRNALAGVDVRDGGEGMLLFALNCLPSTDGSGEVVCRRNTISGNGNSTLDSMDPQLAAVLTEGTRKKLEGGQGFAGVWFRSGGKGNLASSCATEEETCAIESEEEVSQQGLAAETESDEKLDEKLTAAGVSMDNMDYSVGTDELAVQHDRSSSDPVTVPAAVAAEDALSGSLSGSAAVKQLPQFDTGDNDFCGNASNVSGVGVEVEPECHGSVNVHSAGGDEAVTRAGGVSLSPLYEHVSRLTSASSYVTMRHLDLVMSGRVSRDTVPQRQPLVGAALPPAAEEMFDRIREAVAFAPCTR